LSAIQIKKTNCNFEREPLIAPFGFKGRYLTELWQAVALMESQSGAVGLGLGTQSVLWSDARVFAEKSEAAANSLMYLLTAHALKLAETMSFDTPFELLDELLPEVHEYGRQVTSNPRLRLTFALNALVAVDNAAWQLYCATHGNGSFDDMLPPDIRPVLAARHSSIGCIPLMTYGVALPDIVAEAEAGHFLLKIKIGSDPDKDGDQEKMLAWDIARIASIHAELKDLHTPHTDSGHILYYLDANGRYDSKDRLMHLLDAVGKLGALDRIVLLEEPFPEELELDVSNIPARLAADESAHSDKDALKRIEMGYRAIALKPIAKTMSMSLRIAKLAAERSVPCFCADLTVNPILVDWNKNVAARLAPLPGVKIGVVESNGAQNYRNWETMKSYHPCSGATWIEPVDGVFHLDDDFYARGGGILEISDHYRGLMPGA
jgi:L-alanine-DL-glutamate epimerase-like enolase superfamily enzyme